MCITVTEERLLRQDVFPSKVGSRTASVRKSGIPGTPCPTDPSFISHKQSVLHKRYRLKNSWLVCQGHHWGVCTEITKRSHGKRQKELQTYRFICKPPITQCETGSKRRCDPPFSTLAPGRSSCPVSVGRNGRPNLGLEAKEGFIL